MWKYGNQTECNWRLAFAVKLTYTGALGDYAGNVLGNQIFPPRITPTCQLRSGDWTRLSGYHIAQGRTIICCSEFSSPLGLIHVKPCYIIGNCLYYFFDDVSVQPCNKDSLLSVQLDLPNVFTLNSDTTNATYRIRMQNIEKLTVQVLNRWGNLVKEYDGLNEQWDGTTHHGNPVEEGVYFVRAVAVSRFGETLAKQILCACTPVADRIFENSFTLRFEP